MKILVLNASPKGKNSATVHTALYLQALHPEHEFTFVPVGQRIKSYEKDLSPLRTELERADMLLFSYPVYTFIAPSQLHRLIELIKADGVDLSGKFATQITTSKHFYDVTAHRYVEENCLDLGMRVIRGLSADGPHHRARQGGGARFLRPAHVHLRARALRHALPQGPGARAHCLPPEPARDGKERGKGRGHRHELRRGGREPREHDSRLPRLSAL